MGLLDPIECKAARDYLRQGCPIEAARVLLAAKNPDHRAVRQLLVEVARRLIDQAQREVESEQWEAAKNTLELAGKCVALDGHGLELLRRAEQALAERRAEEDARRREQAKAAEMLAQVEELVRLAEFTLALQILEQLRTAGATQAEEKITEVKFLKERFFSAIEECQNALLGGDAGLARYFWVRAKALCPEAPQIKRLAAELAKIAEGGQAEIHRPVPVRDRSQRLILGEIGPLILAEEVALGSPQGENVQLPLLGRVHRRHAILIRDRHGWQIVACQDKHGKPCTVRIDGESVDSVARLRDGHLVQLGNESCLWRFRLPVPGSFTAIWEALPKSATAIACPDARLRKLAILFADELIIRGAAPAHIVLPEFPCERVILRWQDGGLHWFVEGGSAWLEIPGLTWHPGDSQVYLPSRLTVEPELSEAQRLGRVFMSNEVNDRATFAFLPWAF